MAIKRPTPTQLRRSTSDGKIAVVTVEFIQGMGAEQFVVDHREMQEFTDIAQVRGFLDDCRPTHQKVAKDGLFSLFVVVTGADPAVAFDKKMTAVYGDEEWVKDVTRRLARDPEYFVLDTKGIKDEPAEVTKPKAVVKKRVQSPAAAKLRQQKSADETLGEDLKKSVAQVKAKTTAAKKAAPVAKATPTRRTPAKKAVAAKAVPVAKAAAAKAAAKNIVKEATENVATRRAPKPRAAAVRKAVKASRG